MERIREKKKLNIGLRLLSLFLAFFVWIIVVNTSNPEVRETVEVPIEVRNADEFSRAGKIFSMDVDKADISFIVRMNERNHLRTEDFKVYVDLADYSITGAVPVYVDIDSSVRNLISDVAASPMIIHVDIEDLQQKVFELKLSPAGLPADGYVCATEQGELSSLYLEVSAPVSDMGRISGASAVVDVTGLDTDYVGPADVQLLDANGNPLELGERVSFFRDVDCRLPIYRIKQLSVTSGTSGDPAPGFSLDSVAINPTFISVYGPDDILSRYVSIMIPADQVNVSGASSSVTRVIDISPYIPAGLKINGPSTEVTLVVQISRQTQATAAPVELPTEIPEVETETPVHETDYEPEASESFGPDSQNVRETDEDGNEIIIDSNLQETAQIIIFNSKPQESYDVIGADGEPELPAVE